MTCTVALPLPVLPLVTLRKSPLTVACQAQDAGASTGTENTPPSIPTTCDNWFCGIEITHDDGADALEQPEASASGAASASA